MRLTACPAAAHRISAGMGFDGIIRHKIVGAAALIAISSVHICAPVLAAPDIRLSSPASEGSYRVCKSLSQCISILKRHGPDAFDYSLIARDMDRYGEKGRTRLWRFIDDGKTGDETQLRLGNRALNILSRSSKILTPADQRRAAGLWETVHTHDYDPGFIAQILINNLSPLVRSTAIRSLASPNEDAVRLSRYMIDQTLAREMKFAMVEADFAPLAQALKSDPSPALVALIDLYDAEKSTAVLTQLLGSGDAPSVIAAYAALYAHDRETAFKALIKTLYGLGPDESKAALGLSALLAHRHPLRKDGFYMSFSRDVMQDQEMGAMAHLAGFDAIMRVFGPAGFKDIKDYPALKANYAAGLRAMTGKILPEPYLKAAQLFSGGKTPAADAGSWLALLDAAAVHPLSRLAVAEVAGSQDNDTARRISARALQESTDYRLTIAGIFAQTAQAPAKNTRQDAADSDAAQTLTARLDSYLTSHPISMVRGAAKIALAALETHNPRAAILKTQDTLTQVSASLDGPDAYCTVASDNLRQKARAMPFYAETQLAYSRLSERAYLTSGARHSGGWLAGYSRPSSGGLVAYQNDGSMAQELFSRSEFGPQSIIAVQPTQRVVLGQTANAFWVIGQSLITADVTLFRVTQESSAQFAIKAHAHLPALPRAIAIGDAGGISMDLGRSNPPLTLFPNGKIARSCAAK